MTPLLTPHHGPLNHVTCPPPRHVTRLLALQQNPCPTKRISSLIGTTHPHHTSLNLSLPQPRAQSQKRRTPILPTQESFKHRTNTHPNQYLSASTKSYSFHTKTPTSKVSSPSHLVDLAFFMKVDLVHIAIDDTPASPTYTAPTSYPHADIHTVKDTSTHPDPSPSSFHAFSNHRKVPTTVMDAHRATNRSTLPPPPLNAHIPAPQEAILFNPNTQNNWAFLSQNRWRPIGNHLL